MVDTLLASQLGQAIRHGRNTTIAVIGTTITHSPSSHLFFVVVSPPGVDGEKQRAGMERVKWLEYKLWAVQRKAIASFVRLPSPSQPFPSQRVSTSVDSVGMAAAPSRQQTTLFRTRYRRPPQRGSRTRHSQSRGLSYPYFSASRIHSRGWEVGCHVALVGQVLFYQCLLFLFLFAPTG
ncbi:hypothetical protein F4802DRAFT_411946 [Xylaria palmicola]|nr:hypothetical protein F4802DRAFT_411946 [Xylaria palmicola]